MNTDIWTSKLAVLIVFVATFIVAFLLGIYYEQASLDRALSGTITVASSTDMASDSTAPVVGPGEHCGGFIANAPVCGPGYHCQLRVSSPDTGGSCVPDAASPDWTQGLTIITQNESDTTVSLKKNERFVVALGSDLSWSVVVTPEADVTRVPNSVSTGEFQGVYEAVKAGDATLKATGVPICKAGMACPQYARVINVLLHITP